jgi:hypothetical protein
MPPTASTGASRFSFTACALKASPSVNFTPVRRCRVSVRRSAENDHVLTSHGSAAWVAGLNENSESYTAQYIVGSVAEIDS